MKRNDDLLAIIEASYRVEVPEHAWLSGLAQAVCDFGNLNSLGAYAQTYSLPRGGTPSFDDIQIVGDEPERLRAVHDELGAYYATRPDRIIATYGETDEGLALDLPGGERSHIVEILAKWGVGDMYGINARTPSGRGCLLCVYLPVRHRAIPRERREAFARIARHVATAMRLRARLASEGSQEPDAVIGPNGVIHHAIGEAKTTSAREALRAAATKLARVRGPNRKDAPERAVARWKALVDARWSLVDHFERDGSYYVVARRNDPSAPPIHILSERERQVVALAAMGLSNKVIAYELGIASSTVGVLIGRAVARLGVRTRGALIATYLASPRPVI